jgi:hypothetical protein
MDEMGKNLVNAQYHVIVGLPRGEMTVTPRPKGNGGFLPADTTLSHKMGR